MHVSELLKAVEAATTDDLKAVEDEIRADEDRLRAKKAVAALLRVKLGVKCEDSHKKSAPEKPPAAPPQKPAGGLAAETHRRAAAVFLLRTGKPQKVSLLCEECEIPLGSQSIVFNHPWFVRGEDGIRLTSMGHKEMTP